MTERLFVMLRPNAISHYGKWGPWHLPSKSKDEDWKPGTWMPPAHGPLSFDENGYHLHRQTILVYLLGFSIYEAEYRGGRIDAQSKLVVRKARLIRKLETWTDQAARLFACDCAEHVLHLFEEHNPDNPRPHRAIETARRYALGYATPDLLEVAKEAVPHGISVSGGAASEAAFAAAWCAGPENGRSWAIARDVAWMAARGAAINEGMKIVSGNSVSLDERKWQTERLMEYLDGKVELGLAQSDPMSR